jgi:hypothetical protein
MFFIQRLANLAVSKEKEVRYLKKLSAIEKRNSRRRKNNGNSERKV